MQEFKSLLDRVLNKSVDKWPGILGHLTGNSQEILFSGKTYEFYKKTLKRITTQLYNGNLNAPQFEEILSNLVLGQLSDAFETAAKEKGLEVLTPDMFGRLMGMVDSERAYIEGFYRAIIDARLENKPLETLWIRVNVWANRWNEAYDEAKHMIVLAKGGKEIWLLGKTEKHCKTCKALENKVAFASEWETSGLRPQNPPNDLLECEGWLCDCKREETDKRRSPKVLDELLDIAVMAAEG